MKFPSYVRRVDEILLRAWGSIDIDYRSTVDRNGLLNLPKVGSFEELK